MGAIKISRSPMKLSGGRGGTTYSHCKDKKKKEKARKQGQIGSRLPPNARGKERTVKEGRNKHCHTDINQIKNVHVDGRV